MIVKIGALSARRLVSTLSATLALLVLSGPAVAGKPELTDTTITRGTTAAGFHYMTGGLVFDERQAMERQSERYNLKLVFGPRWSAFASPVLLLIGDNRGRRVEKVTARGPWFYIRLPSGGYTIVARIGDKLVLIRDVYLHENRRATYFVRGN
jgi:hypothetical protein